MTISLYYVLHVYAWQTFDSQFASSDMGVLLSGVGASLLKASIASDVGFVDDVSA